MTRRIYQRQNDDRGWRYSFVSRREANRIRAPLVVFSRVKGLFRRIRRGARYYVNERPGAIR